MMVAAFYRKNIPKSKHAIKHEK